MPVTENQMKCMYAKNYQNRPWFNKVIAKIKWYRYSFILTHMVDIRFADHTAAWQIIAFIK